MKVARRRVPSATMPPTGDYEGVRPTASGRQGRDSGMSVQGRSRSLKRDDRVAAQRRQAVVEPGNLRTYEGPLYEAQRPLLARYRHSHVADCSTMARTRVIDSLEWSATLFSPPRNRRSDLLAGSR